jgi:hypothetical protein
LHCCNNRIIINFKSPVLFTGDLIIKQNMATKKIVEKKTGEKYASKAAMAKHEKKETKATEKKEMMKPKGPMQLKSMARAKKC